MVSVRMLINAPHYLKEPGLHACMQAAGGAPSPGMSFGFRIRLWLLNMGSLAAIMLWQKVVAEGPVSSLLRRTFPSNRPQFNM